jgi:hypothetical protein
VTRRLWVRKRRTRMRSELPLIQGQQRYALNGDCMTTDIKGEKPDYKAMANILEQIARELRQKSGDQDSQSDMEQIKRLERIVANIKSAVA